jgi:AraC family transcriptional regulator
METYIARANDSHCRTSWTWPGRLSVVASSGIDPGAVGHAAILRGRLPDFLAHEAPATLIAFALTGTSRVEWRRGGRLCRFVAAPGGFTIAPGGGDSAFRTETSLEGLTLLVTPHQFRAIADRECVPHRPSIEIVPACQKSTPELVALGQAFAGLLRTPRTGNGLYAQSLWTQIAIQVLWNFSSLPRPGEARFERLSDGRVRRVVEYVEAALADPVSLPDLADLAGLSPNHFLNAFKKATGQTPHRYLTERRIARACELLRNPQTPLANVALAVGFSSQSHFTTVFGRFMKTTPASYRMQVLGLKTRSG